MDDFRLVCLLQQMAWIIREVAEGRSVDGLELKDMDTRISDLARGIQPTRREDYDEPTCPGSFRPDPKEWR